MSNDISHSVIPVFELNESARFANFIKLPRSLILMWSKVGVNSSVFCCYLYLVTTAVFDERNQLFGVCPLPTKDLPKLFRSSPSTVRSWLKELQSLGLIDLTPDGYAVISKYKELFRELSSEAKNLNRKGEDNLFLLFPELKKMSRNRDKSKGGA